MVIVNRRRGRSETRERALNGTKLRTIIVSHLQLDGIMRRIQIYQMNRIPPGVTIWILHVK